VSKLKVLFLALVVVFLAFQIHRHSIGAKGGGVESLPVAATGQQPAEPAKPIVSASHALENYRDLLTKNGETLDGQGIIVQTLDGKRIVASHNIDHTFNPASVTKIATSLAALVKFGPNYHMRTKLYADGSIDPATRTINGDLVVDGDGDPMFYEENARILAQNLTRAGVSRVTGDMVIKGAFSINRSAQPELSAERMFNALRGAGVKIAGTRRFGEGRGGQTELVVHESGTPLIQVLLYQNAHSDNAMAERIGDAIGGPQALTNFLIETVGIPKDDVYISRTSGLDYNRITPEGMMKVMNRLMKLLDDEKLKPEDLLPVAGVDAGTLHARFKGDEWHGAVIGKTGSLPATDGGVSTLAGIAYTQKYGPVLYAIFNTGGNVHQYRKWQDDLLEGVVDECGGPMPVARLENALDQEIRLEPTVKVYSAAKTEPTQ
jgi:D-alanyl-D-alanine carboxypeptidase/D-alanyl-D-alanine-endopeptidase (penicillin-binding protein 4)